MGNQVIKLTNLHSGELSWLRGCRSGRPRFPKRGQDASCKKKKNQQISSQTTAWMDGNHKITLDRSDAEKWVSNSK